MAITNVFLLVSAVLPAVFAIPQHGHLGHGGHLKRNILPSGLSTGFPHPSGVPGSAPYPAQNVTASGPTGTGTGPVTIHSTINIIPLPVTHTEYAASSTGSLGQVGESGSPGSGSGSGESGTECGAATVTVTQANTVTVTVGGSNGGAPSNAPIVSSPAIPSIPAASSYAPFPIGNSSIPAGSTGSGSAVLPSVPTHIPVPTSHEVSSSATPVQVASSAATPLAPLVSSSAPAEAASSVASSPAVVVPTSSVEAHAYYHMPGAGSEHYSPKAPVVPASSTLVSFPAPVASSSASPAPVEQPTTSAPAPVVSSAVSQAASSAPASSSSSAPVKTNTGLKARGILYGGPEANAALSNANSYLGASNGAMGWGWNWDSSPAPAAGHKTGTLDVQFVPMLLSAIDTHTSLWNENSAGYPYLMGFNEPDMTTDKGGSQMDVGSCVQNWNTYMQPKASGSVKLISPGVTNNLDDSNMGLHYLTSFLDQCKGCTIDVLAFHYYGKASDLDYFKNTVQQFKNLQTQHGIPELWITEMAPTELPTKEQMDGFLEFLDSSESGVSRYAFNGLNTGTGQSLDNAVIKEAYCA